VYHKSGFLQAEEGEKSNYAQVYLYDHNEALENRRDNPYNCELDEGLLEDLQTMMERVSPYAQAYRHMKSVVEEEFPEQIPGTKLVIAQDHPGDDMRRYNKPKVYEPAVVFRSPDGAPPSNRDIVVWPKREDRSPYAAPPSARDIVLWPRNDTYTCYRIDDKSEHVDPLAYPLLFPYGDGGWQPGLRHSGERHTEKYTRLTPTQFYSYRLMLRDYQPEEDEEEVPWPHTAPSLPHSGKVLFQMWICDAYSRAEAHTLAWYKLHQKDLRADTYSDLLDAVNDPSFVAGSSPIGKKIILPATYPGCPRAMAQNYLDAMSIVKRYGKPDFFITMTANPSWPEITNALRCEETAANRPDIVARVFKTKLEVLLKHLLKEDVLGKVVAYTWVIEFQKRGLPHVHMLIIVRPEDKPRTPQDVDARISAELPDPNNPEQSDLLQILLGSQIHGPCGVRNPSCPCMVENACSKGFPKDFVETTELRADGYPKYRRRQASPCVTKGSHVVDARDVVPYNAYLSKRLKCHLNVEYCGTIRAVKYLYKYTFKGHDRARLEFQQDEIKQYVDARYVGPPEACWRIFNFPMHSKSHSIERLAVHLKGGESIFSRTAKKARRLKQGRFLLYWDGLL
jgi:hypothetical protein